jgi:signal recognition particle subunit SRP54
MGPLREVLGKLPMFGDLAEQVDEKELGRVEAIIQSMTPGERKQPDVIDKSRAGRIAGGCGRATRDVLDLVNRFRQMREMMGSLGSGGGALSRLPGMGGLAGAGDGMGGFDPSMLMGEGNRKARRQQAAQNKSGAKKKRKAARAARRKGRRK